MNKSKITLAKAVNNLTLKLEISYNVKGKLTKDTIPFDADAFLEFDFRDRKNWQRLNYINQKHQLNKYVSVLCRWHINTKYASSRPSVRFKMLAGLAYKYVPDEA